MTRPRPAAWAWLIILVGLIAFEAWAAGTGNATLSQWLWSWESRAPWMYWASLAAFGLLIYHLFFSQKGQP